MNRPHKAPTGKFCHCEQTQAGDVPLIENTALRIYSDHKHCVLNEITEIKIIYIIFIQILNAEKTVKLSDDFAVHLLVSKIEPPGLWQGLG